MRVLITVPTFPTPPHVEPRTQASIDALLANTQVEHEIVYQGDDDPALGHYENLCRKHNSARQRVLAEGFDALFSLEADMLVPADALDTLLQVDADIVYGLYCGRETYIWLHFTQMSETKAISIVADPQAAKAAWGQVVPSKGAGMGCTLIRRNVLEQVPFRIDKARPHFADDWYFALDANAAGFRSAHHMGVVCGHVMRSGSIVWPDIRCPRPGRFIHYRIDPIASEVHMPTDEIREFTAIRTLYLAGSKRYVKPGEIVRLSLTEAKQMGRAVEEVAPKKAAKPAAATGAKNDAQQPESATPALSAPKEPDNADGKAVT